MENPIVNNRMVSDYTYAVRNLSFLSKLYPDAPLSCQIVEEEFEYLCIVACDLVRYQVETCPDSEKWYFKNLVSAYTSYKDIIKWCCGTNEHFYKFLKVINAL